MAVNTRSLVQGNAAQVQSLPAPLGGWNARDSYANMDPMDAVTLENMFPTVSNVTLRGGYSKWATGLDGQIQSLFVYSSGTTDKMFAVTETSKLYNVTASGAVGAPVLSSLGNGKWEYTNITTSGGSFLYATNGVNEPLLYDGSTWTEITGISSPAITGVTTTNLINVLLFKNRIWFIEKDTLKAWYLPTSSVGGAAQFLDLSSVCRYGGKLVDFNTWTIDGGFGIDDMLAFVTSNGEVIVYRGTDPASASTWALTGIWKFGSPIGSRSMIKYGGDLLLLTYDGLLPMSQAMQSDRLDSRVALSDKIQGAIAAATSTYGSASVGWQLVYSAKNNAIMVNVPVAVGQQQQYVMNTITKSWCNFTGWNANCWDIYGENLYFGGNGYVAKAWDSTYADDGANIVTNTIQAFNYMGSRGVKKYFTRARPNIFTNGQPGIFVGANLDFNILNNSAPLTYTPSVYGVWDTGVWDTALWGSDLDITNNYLGITGIGYCIGLQVKTASSLLQVEWAATDLVYQTGWAGI